MAKDKTEDIQEVVEVKEREIQCVFISDGFYKYIYVDTGEDVTNPEDKGE